ncbi:zinc-binding dehydrogenase [Cellulomonas sp. JZ18]|uniref:zinc-binding dehydrogenase n=1 Tax=Cellulomonas sp. JZ18 TaxID=2654191 RepID=UPI0012D4B32B|nr:zinc-binding dehydrogenase [Cellulomonas sp. JZ18]QGQ20380.1 zinc-binding dehydrogenase [Cellulomonas sp. JZ18]
MLSARVTAFSADDPLSGLEVGDASEPDVLAHPPAGWTTVEVRAASLNHHDLWSLRGVGLGADRLPMVLGTDAAGVTEDGRPVVVHAVVGGPDGRGVDPDEPRSLLSERYPGTLAERVAVPAWNVVPKPPELGWVEAACVPTAYLTAYRMLFRSGGAQPGQRVLVQGAGGGLSVAAVQLGAAAGLEMVVTGRDAGRRERALALGAAAAVEPGARVGRVDVVLDSVGRATWEHSVRSVRPGGRVVVAGLTSGDPAPASLTRVFFQEISVVGATMGTRDELGQVLAFLARTGVRPLVDSTYPLARAADALGRMWRGEQFGKIVLEV